MPIARNLRNENFIKDIEKDKKKIQELNEKFKKCTVCGVYVPIDKIINSFKHDNQIYSCVCTNCRGAILNEQMNLQLQRYDGEFIEDIDNDSGEEELTI